MIKVKFKHYKWDSYKDGTSPLFIELSLNRKRTFIKTNVNCKVEDWDDKRNLLRKSFSNSAQLNEAITKQINEVTSIALGCKELTEVKNKINGVEEKKVDQIKLLDYIKEVTLDYEKQGRIGSAKTFSSLYSILNKFRPDTLLAELNHKFLMDFETFMRSRKICTNGVGIKMRCLRIIANRLLKENLVTEYSFRHFPIKKSQTQKRWLSVETIKKIANFNYPKDDRIISCQLAADLFLFSTLSCGANCADLAIIKRSSISNNRITYNRKKTKAVISIQISEQLQKLLDKYKDNPIVLATDQLFPILDVEFEKKSLKHQHQFYLDRLGMINRRLKEIADYCSVPPFTFYAARHSYSQAALVLDSPIMALSSSLGHKSLTTTQIYLDQLGHKATDLVASDVAAAIFNSASQTH